MSRYSTIGAWTFSNAAMLAADKIPARTVNEQSHRVAHTAPEPLLIAMDALYHYACSYLARYGGGLEGDSILGQYWLSAAKGIRGLLNGDGAIAMDRNITTDSKDNGAIEKLFWDALRVAGFTEKDLQDSTH